MDKLNYNRNKINQYVKYSSIGMELLILIGLGVWGGVSLDKSWNTLPLFTVIFPLLGLGIGLYHLIKMLNQDAKNKTS